MNAAISTLVAIFSVAVVVGVTVYGVQALFGQYTILLWILLGWCAFMGIMKVVNS